MKEINNSEIVYVMQYNNKSYICSDRKKFIVGDIFFDRRCDEYRQIETEKDICNMSFTAPECYIILEEYDETKRPFIK